MEQGAAGAKTMNPRPAAPNAKRHTPRWEFPEIRGTLGFPLKGYYKGTIRVPFKGLYKGLEFPEIRGTVFGGPYNKDPTI